MHRSDHDRGAPASEPKTRTGMGLAEWAGAAGLATLGVVAAEYLFNALLNPRVDWSPKGVAAHMAIDLALVLLVAMLAVFAGTRLGRRLGWSDDGVSSVFGTVGVVALVFLLLAHGRRLRPDDPGSDTAVLVRSGA